MVTFDIFLGGDILLLVAIGRGDAWLRNFAGILILGKGVVQFMIFGWMAIAMLANTPLEDLNRFFYIATFVLGDRIVLSFLYVAAGICLIWSPSVKAYIEHLAFFPCGPIFQSFDYVLGFVGLDRISRMKSRMLHNIKNPRVPVLTKKKMLSLDDDELVCLIRDYASAKIRKDGRPEIDAAMDLPAGVRAVYSTWWLRSEYYNGGLFQYFVNKGLVGAAMALEGYRLFGSTELARLVEEAIDIYLAEKATGAWDNSIEERLLNWKDHRELLH